MCLIILLNDGKLIIKLQTNTTVNLWDYICAMLYGYVDFIYKDAKFSH